MNRARRIPYRAFLPIVDELAGGKDLTKKAARNIEKTARRIIRMVSKLDIDETYKVGAFAALLTRQLANEEFSTKRDLHERKSESKVVTLADRIIELRERNFFKQPRSDLDVHAAITKNYPCVRNRVSVELLRLAKKRELRRTESKHDGRTVVAYVW
jgi:hypothetical protein